METPRPNREISRKQAPAGERPPLDAIHEAATPVKTTILARRGVEKVRILSESRLQSLLGSARGPPANGTVEERPVTAQGPPGTPGPLDAGPDLDAPALRALHEAAIGAIEKRMERLSGALQTIFGALERLEGLCPAERPREADGVSGVERDLLRKMLL